MGGGVSASWKDNKRSALAGFLGFFFADSAPSLSLKETHAHFVGINHNTCRCSSFVAHLSFINSWLYLLSIGKTKPSSLFRIKKGAHSSSQNWVNLILEESWFPAFGSPRNWARIQELYLLACLKKKNVCRES